MQPRRQGDGLVSSALGWFTPEQRSTVGFVLFFGLFQAMYFAYTRTIPPPVPEPGPDKTLVILDGGGLAAGQDSTSLDDLLQKPAAVLTFDSQGFRKSSKLSLPPKPPSASPTPTPSPKPPSASPTPPPSPKSPSASSTPPPVPELSSASPTPPPAPEQPSSSPTPSPISAATSSTTPAAAPAQTPSPAIPEGSAAEATLESAAQPPDQTSIHARSSADQSGDPARMVSSEHECRRPHYVWAQNRTHLFVTLRLETVERALRLSVNFGPRSLSASSSAQAVGTAAAGVSCISIHLDLYRSIRPPSSHWQTTNRGILLRAHKERHGHWNRLLQSDAYDGKQGIDWARFSHPDATRAEHREGREAQFDERNAARMRAIGALRPRFDVLLREAAAKKERDEMLSPPEQHEMLNLGEQILTHYREEREDAAALRGDAPLPAGVDEEQLERALLKLREYKRKGALEYDRNSVSFKEHRRRQRKRQEWASKLESAEMAARRTQTSVGEGSTRRGRQRRRGKVGRHNNEQ